MRKYVLLTAIIGIFISANVAGAYSLIHDLQPTEGDNFVLYIEINDTIRPDSGSFNNSWMLVFWTNPDLQCVNGFYTFQFQQSVSSHCTPYYTGSWTVSASASNGAQGSESFEVVVQPEFGKTGPVISIFVIGMFYMFLRKRRFEK